VQIGIIVSGNVFSIKCDIYYKISFIIKKFKDRMQLIRVWRIENLTSLRTQSSFGRADLFLGSAVQHGSARCPRISCLVNAMGAIAQIETPK
jgi:hypothetical protein